MSATKVLVLDANQRSALAATRSLGRAGHSVHVADECAASLSGASKYCRGEHVYPSPYDSPDEFISWLTDLAGRRQFNVVYPMTEVTTDLIARHRHKWPDVTIPLAAIESIDRLSDKVLLFEQAVKSGVPVPESVIVRNRTDLELAIETIGVPAYLKPRRSKLLMNGSFINTSVHRVESREDVLRLYELPQFHNEHFLYQSPVTGSGRGIFALYDNGKPLIFFCHRRLREKPPEGGVSVLSESHGVDPSLYEHARRLLTSVHWHGVAMVEFKGDGDQARLMEVNARFWGSLQLAIDAGVDFPKLLHDVANHLPLRLPTHYRQNVRLKWFLGDLDRLYLVLKSQAPYRKKARAFYEFLLPDLGRTRHETFRWKDPFPALRELRQYIRFS